MKRKFIRVFLKSGSEFSPMGAEEVAIYCQCDEENPSLADVNIIELENWVNGNSGCKKNQSSELFTVSKDLDSMKIIALESREMQSCQKSDRIFPRMQGFCPGT